MRTHFTATWVALLLLIASCAGVAWAEDAGRKRIEPASACHSLAIHPAQTEHWEASLSDVEEVLCSAAHELWQFFPGRSLPPILVEPRGGPIVLYRRGPQEEIRVRLDTGKLYWAQYAFQFAHEFGHILCNYREHDDGNKWFEESLCETASLFALRGMAATWKTDPPYPNWRDYAPALQKYADRRIAEVHLSEDTTLAGWYRLHESELRSDPCLRRLNRVVAAELLPLFEKRPRRWEAVAYLNLGEKQPSRSFQEYLQGWWQHAPQKHRPFIRRIAKKFGVAWPVKP